MSQSLSIAVIEGDGIGKEVIPEGVRVLQAAAQRYHFELRIDTMPWGDCGYYQTTGAMMPTDWKTTLASYDAIYLGAVGWPATVPDHVSLWGSLLKIRREFDQYVNLRPVKLFAGVPCPLRNKSPEDLDFWIVRENTEGEYTDIGGIMFADTDRELVLQQSVHTRFGSDRVLRYAYELAQSTQRKSLTVATKSNGLAISMPWWDARARAIGEDYPAIKVDIQHIDALAAKFVLKPEAMNVVVAPNLFGDILSDLGPACAGTLGIAPSANLNPDGTYPSLFEPVHGSSPDIAGQGIANPVGAIWSAALLLKYSRNTNSTHHQAAEAIISAIQTTLAGDSVTRDLGGTASTTAMTDTLLSHLVG